jgi:putative resolvase
MFISYITVKKDYDIGRSTLSGWADRGLLKVRRLPGGKRLYHDGDLRSILGDPESQPEKKKIVYTRVSSSKQKTDLQRQQDTLRQQYPDHEFLSDVGSGLNFKRPQFNAILERVYKGDISEIVVAYRDRLCRYRFELVEWICAKHGAKIVVHNKGENTVAPESELAEDLLAVCNFFVARNNGRRASENRKRRRELEDKEDKAEHHKKTKRSTKTVVRGSSMDVQQMSEHVQGEKVSDAEGCLPSEGSQ